MNFKKSVLSFINDKDISKTEFAEKCGINRTQMSNYLGGRNSPGTEIIKKIIKVYPEFEHYWSPKASKEDQDTQIDNLIKEQNALLAEQNRILQEQGHLLALILKKMDNRNG